MNWFGLSTLIGVECDGDPSATHCNTRQSKRLEKTDHAQNVASKLLGWGISVKFPTLQRSQRRLGRTLGSLGSETKWKGAVFNNNFFQQIWLMSSCDWLALDAKMWKNFCRLLMQWIESFWAGKKTTENRTEVNPDETTKIYSEICRKKEEVKIDLFVKRHLFQSRKKQF